MKGGGGEVVRAAVRSAVRRAGLALGVRVGWARDMIGSAGLILICTRMLWTASGVG